MMIRLRFLSAFLIAAMALASCSHLLSDDEKLERILAEAGDNRVQLEKVLSRYASDPERLEGARLLIINMPLHFTTGSGVEADRYREYFRVASDHSFDPKEVADSLDALHGKPQTARMQRIPDITTLDSAFLCAHIDAAFEARDSRPWGRNVRQEDFLEFVVPYRVGDEPATLWRRTVLDRYGDLIDSVAALPGSSDPLFAADALFRGWMARKDFHWTSRLPWGPRIGVDIIDWKIGTCREKADALTYLLRAAGLPAAMHMAPLRGDHNASHYWGVAYDSEGLPHIAEQRFDAAPVYRVPAAKVHGESFVIDEETLRTFAGNPKAPSALRNPYVSDVTELYLDPAARHTLRLPLTMLPGAAKGDTLYLAGAAKREWVPVGYGVAGRDSVDFGFVGRNVVCVAGTFDGRTFRPMTVPFRHDGDGATVCYEPGPMAPVRVFSKYSGTVGDFAGRMVGAVFETSDTPDFASVDTIYSIEECPKRLFTEVAAKETVPRRYVRYKGGRESYCNVADIALYEHAADTVRLTGRPMGTPESFDEDHHFSYVWDGDPYTSMDCPILDYAWTGLDLGQPRRIGRIVYTPRNRDNYVHRGYTYELFYFGQEGRWVSLGRAKAETDVLEMEAPQGALLYLHCLDGGDSERIFVYDPDSDSQIFL